MQPNVSGKGNYALPNGDVVLYALVYVANAKGVHPYSIMQEFVRRPALNHWLSGHTSAMHYSVMRKLIAKLVNEHGVVFDADGFSYCGQSYIRCRNISLPPIKANPSAL